MLNESVEACHAGADVGEPLRPGASGGEEPKVEATAEPQGEAEAVEERARKADAGVEDTSSADSADEGDDDGPDAVGANDYVDEDGVASLPRSGLTSPKLCHGSHGPSRWTRCWV